MHLFWIRLRRWIKLTNKHIWKMHASIFIKHWEIGDLSIFYLNWDHRDTLILDDITRPITNFTFKWDENECWQYEKNYFLIACTSWAILSIVLIIWFKSRSLNGFQKGGIIPRYWSVPCWNSKQFKTIWKHRSTESCISLQVFEQAQYY